LVFFLAICTQPHGIYGERMKCEMTRQGDLRKRYFIQTVNTIAYRTNEMDMLVMMVVFGTVRSTHGIGCCTIQIEYFMYDFCLCSSLFLMSRELLSCTAPTQPLQKQIPLSGFSSTITIYTYEATFPAILCSTKLGYGGSTG